MEDPVEPVGATLDEKTSRQEEKKRAILEACARRNFKALEALAVSPGGFLTDSIRQQAWPILLGLDPNHPPASDQSWQSLPRHKDEDQVQLDVNRAFVYYPNHQTETQLHHQKTALSSLILSTLRQHPYLSYFQGYHDICQVLLLTLPPSTLSPSLAHLSVLRIRDFMLPSLTPAIAQLRLLPDILQKSDPKLWHHLSSTEPFFALSGTLTMYAHDITTLGEITRLFDVLLSKDPVFTIYLFASIVRSRRQELFETPPDEPEMLHSILSKLPIPLDLEGLIQGAIELETKYPPESLRTWRRYISRWSVLKTARHHLPPPALSSEEALEQGRVFFERQVRELQWKEQKEKMLEAIWRYRRPARTVGFAVLVGVAALLLRKYQYQYHDGGPLGYVYSLVARWWSRW
ncbi:rab-GTPase-TBC domain-containing protein [Podospora australis]|uniref:Rab-GTPase-TBC domain-containing protein n=1 Tax=Podospora australis TaxID=1536484 RepID=A0AAN6X4V7_9PEZI|nr:rab-GTPase-TBC domain-containing protein [Podospora australis]